MGLYSRYVLPKLIDAACRGESNAQQREKVVPLAHGDVLEIGIGTGLNLSHYDSDRVTRVIGVDPSPRITRLAQEAADEAPTDRQPRVDTLRQHSVTCGAHSHRTSGENRVASGHRNEPSMSSPRASLTKQQHAFASVLLRVSVVAYRGTPELRAANGEDWLPNTTGLPDSSMA